MFHIWNISVFEIWATLFQKSYSTRVRLASMSAQSVRLLGVSQDRRLRGISICSAGLWRLVALASYVSFDIKCFAIRQDMGPAPWGKAGVHNHSLETQMFAQSRKILNWQVQPLIKPLWLYWRDKAVMEFQMLVPKRNSYLTVKSHLY